MEKMTKKEMFEMIKGVCANDTRIVEFCDHEIELLNRKNSKSSQTKTQKENEVIMERVLVALQEVGRPVCVDELRALNTEMGAYSNQKLSALLRKMVDMGKVEKTEDKRKSYFSAIVD